jgi:hypothetical protein
MRRFMFAVASLVLSSTISANDALPQVSQTASPTWQETIEWLIPAFSQNARSNRTFRCYGRGGTPIVRKYSDSAEIAKYYYSTPSGITDLDLKMRFRDSDSENGDTDEEDNVRLPLNTLSPDISVNKHDLITSSPCSWDRSAFYEVFIASTDRKKTITYLDANATDKYVSTITIEFSDESMAKRCASALSHLIVLAGGKTTKPPPF